MQAIVAPLRSRLQPSEEWLEEVRRLEAVEDAEALEGLLLKAAQVERVQAFEQGLAVPGGKPRAHHSSACGRRA